MEQSMRCSGVVVMVAVVMLAMMVFVSEAGGVVSSLSEAQSRLHLLRDRLSPLWTKMGAKNPYKTKIQKEKWGVRLGQEGLGSAQALKSSLTKLKSFRDVLVRRFIGHSRLFPSSNHSIISIAFLAFGVLLFDVLGSALLGGGGAATGRETELPGLGLLGDLLNNLIEVALNTLTIYFYREESPDCGERLLCESSQQAERRGLLDGLATYLSGLVVSFFLPEAPLSRSLEAMRAGRMSSDCVQLYPHCPITL